MKDFRLGVLDKNGELKEVSPEFFKPTEVNFDISKEDEANATLRFKAWEEAYEARKEAKKAVKATPEYKDWEEVRKDYKKVRKDYKKVRKDYKKARKDYKKAWETYDKAKEKKQEAAKVHDEAVEAVYATPEYAEWDAMCTTQEALDELWK